MSLAMCTKRMMIELHLLVLTTMMVVKKTVTQMLVTLAIAIKMAILMMMMLMSMAEMKTNSLQTFNQLLAVLAAYNIL